MTETKFTPLPADWYRYVVAPGVSEDVPGIYEWHIEGTGSYIGQFGCIRRPRKEYGRNVIRLLNKRPYRAGNPDGFRRIHLELVNAHRTGARITLTILENIPDRIERNRRERELIAIRGVLNDPSFGRPSLETKRSVVEGLDYPD